MKETYIKQQVMNTTMLSDETGRSMVEMLGTLAIIGVLSVGGIEGYSSAMRSHRANEIIDAASGLFMLGRSSNVGAGDKQMDVDSSRLPNGCEAVHYNGDKQSVSVTITNLDVCKTVKTKFGSSHGDCTGNKPVLKLYFEGTEPCFTADTPITLANGTYKRADEVTYDDELLVWNFDEGRFDKAKPLWLKVPEKTNKYNYLKFSDGSILKTVGQHRIFNREAGRFTYPMTDDTPIGTTTLNAKGEWVTLVEKRVVEEEVIFYNIITIYHINCFAGNVLTSCRFNNLYPIKDLKFVKDNRTLVGYDEYAELPRKWYDGLRLAEQPQEVNRGNDVPHGTSIIDHIQRVYISKAQ